MSDHEQQQIADLTERLLATREQREDWAKFALDMRRERDEVREELERCKTVVTDANNSLYGSQGFFLGMNGGFDPRHLSKPIEGLKKQCRDEYAAAKALTADRDRLAAAVERVRGCERVDCVVDWENGLLFEEPQCDGPYMLAADILAALEGA
jgi:hypothetical protein